MNISTYRDYDTGEIRLEMLLEICEERLMLYKIMETARLENMKIGSIKWFEHLKVQIRTQDLKFHKDLVGPENSDTIEQSRRFDNIAHWILGYSYCQKEDMQQVYVDWEIQWFHFLFMNSTEEGREKFLTDNEFIYPTVDDSEKLKLISGLEPIANKDVFDTKFYKIYFTECPELLSELKVYLELGTAYLTEENIIYCVKRKLKREFLTRVLAQKRAAPNITMPQFEHIRDHLSTLLVLQKKINLNLLEGIHLGNIEETAEEHYPMCMRHIHRVLKKRHHLKYDCRMQYGIFLYYLGLPLEDALEFWKKEFTQCKEISEKRYKREYEYLLKHQYGTVGRRKPYDPGTCDTILSSNPGFEFEHGCPFKHWGRNDLMATVKEDICSSGAVKDIEDLVKDGRYQRACTRYLCGRRNIHPDGIMSVIESPNEYVEQSITIEDGIEGGVQYKSEEE